MVLPVSTRALPGLLPPAFPHFFLDCPNIVRSLVQRQIFPQGTTIGSHSSVSRAVSVRILTSALSTVTRVWVIWDVSGLMGTVISCKSPAKEVSSSPSSPPTVGEFRSLILKTKPAPLAICTSRDQPEKTCGQSPAHPVAHQPHYYPPLPRCPQFAARSLAQTQHL